MRAHTHTHNAHPTLIGAHPRAERLTLDECLAHELDDTAQQSALHDYRKPTFVCALPLRDDQHEVALRRCHLHAKLFGAPMNFLQHQNKRLQQPQDMANLPSPSPAAVVQQRAAI